MARFRGPAAAGQYFCSVDSVCYLTVVLKLLLGQALDVVVINSGLDQAVGVLAEVRVHLDQPVGHVMRIAGGVVCVGLQHAQVSQKPCRMRRETAGQGRGEGYVA